MARDIARLLDRWRQAALLTPEQADRILAFENQGGGPGLRWPVAVALATGGVMVAAGILLFVAANWGALAPTARLVLLAAVVVGAHFIATYVSTSFPALGTTLHALGTVALGAGIFLSGQTFHLQTNWPEGFLLWGAGAVLGWVLLRDWPHAALSAILVPAWLVALWARSTAELTGQVHPLPVAGVLFLSLAYLFAHSPAHDSPPRRALSWVGGLALFPAALMTIAFAQSHGGSFTDSLPAHLWLVGWVASLAIPAGLLFPLRRDRAWIAIPLAIWVALGANLSRDPDWLAFAWAGAGAAGIAVLGATEGSRYRVNVGMAGFNLTVLIFYFSSVMTRLDRATSLIVGGLVLLGGGWVLEQLRRRLVARATLSAP